MKPALKRTGSTSGFGSAEARFPTDGNGPPTGRSGSGTARSRAGAGGKTPRGSVSGPQSGRKPLPRPRSAFGGPQVNRASSRASVGSDYDDEFKMNIKETPSLTSSSSSSSGSPDFRYLESLKKQDMGLRFPTGQAPDLALTMSPLGEENITLDVVVAAGSELDQAAFTNEDLAYIAANERLFNKFRQNQSMMHKLTERTRYLQEAIKSGKTDTLKLDEKPVPGEDLQNAKSESQSDVVSNFKKDDQMGKRVESMLNDPIPLNIPLKDDVRLHLQTMVEKERIKLATILMDAKYQYEGILDKMTEEYKRQIQAQRASHVKREMELLAQQASLSNQWTEDVECLEKIFQKQTAMASQEQLNLIERYNRQKAEAKAILNKYNRIMGQHPDEIDLTETNQPDAVPKRLASLEELMEGPLSARTPRSARKRAEDIRNGTASTDVKLPGDLSTYVTGQPDSVLSPSMPLNKRSDSGVFNSPIISASSTEESLNKDGTTPRRGSSPPKSPARRLLADIGAQQQKNSPAKSPSRRLDKGEDSAAAPASPTPTPAPAEVKQEDKSATVTADDGKKPASPSAKKGDKSSTAGADDLKKPASPSARRAAAAADKKAAEKATDNKSQKNGKDGSTAKKREDVKKQGKAPERPGSSLSATVDDLLQEVKGMQGELATVVPPGPISKKPHKPIEDMTPEELEAYRTEQELLAAQELKEKEKLGKETNNAEKKKQDKAEAERKKRADEREAKRLEKLAEAKKKADEEAEKKRLKEEQAKKAKEERAKSAEDKKRKQKEEKEKKEREEKEKKEREEKEKKERLEREAQEKAEKEAKRKEGKTIMKNPDKEIEAGSKLPKPGMKRAPTPMGNRRGSVSLSDTDNSIDENKHDHEPNTTSPESKEGAKDRSGPARPPPKEGSKDKASPTAAGAPGRMADVAQNSPTIERVEQVLRQQGQVQGRVNSVRSGDEDSASISSVETLASTMPPPSVDGSVVSVASGASGAATKPAAAAAEQKQVDLSKMSKKEQKEWAKAEKKREKEAAEAEKARKKAEKKAAKEAEKAAKEASGEKSGGFFSRIFGLGKRSKSALDLHAADTATTAAPPAARLSNSKSMPQLASAAPVDDKAVSPRLRVAPGPVMSTPDSELTPKRNPRQLNSARAVLTTAGSSDDKVKADRDVPPPPLSQRRESIELPPAGPRRGSTELPPKPPRADLPPPPSPEDIAADVAKKKQLLRAKFKGTPRFGEGKTTVELRESSSTPDEDKDDLITDDKAALSPPSSPTAGSGSLSSSPSMSSVKGILSLRNKGFETPDHGRRVSFVFPSHARVITPEATPRDSDDLPEDAV